MVYKYRVYLKNIHGGKCYGYFLAEEYEKAEAIYLSLVENISPSCQAAFLQELDPEWQWVSKNILKLETDEYKANVDHYWKAQEEKERDWHAGDAPWEAPGMSIHDFI